MKEMITIVLSVLSVLLAVFLGVSTYMEDNNAPVISLEGSNTLVYNEGEAYDVLLEGMTAEDEEDGDVTDSLRISSVYPIDENKMIVVYVAKDEANNIAKLKREVRYQTKSETSNTEEVEEPTEVTEEEPETTRTEETTQEDTAATQNASNVNPNGPTITLIQNEVTLKVGETFNILRFVENAVDADGTSLSRYIHADGNYDTSQPGVYSIRVYATSPNGGTSNIETFTLTVEP